MTFLAQWWEPRTSDDLMRASAHSYQYIQLLAETGYIPRLLIGRFLSTRLLIGRFARVPPTHACTKSYWVILDKKNHLIIQLWRFWTPYYEMLKHKLNNSHVATRKFSAKASKRQKYRVIDSSANGSVGNCGALEPEWRFWFQLY